MQATSERGLLIILIAFLFVVFYISSLNRDGVFNAFFGIESSVNF